MNSSTVDFLRRLYHDPARLADVVVLEQQIERAREAIAAGQPIELTGDRFRDRAIRRLATRGETDGPA